MRKGGFPLVELIRAKRIFASEFFRTKTFLIPTKQKVRTFIFFNNTDNFVEKKMAVDNLSKVLIYRKSLILKLLALQSLKQKSQKRKRFWMRRIYLGRQQKGEFHLLVREMMLFDHEYFFKCFRMTLSTYEQLLDWLAALISKESTKMRESIGASERLAVTLRY